MIADDSLFKMRGSPYFLWRMEDIPAYVWKNLWGKTWFHLKYRRYTNWIRLSLDEINIELMQEGIDPIVPRRMIQLWAADDIIHFGPCPGQPIGRIPIDEIPEMLTDAIKQSYPGLTEWLERRVKESACPPPAGHSKD